MVNESTIQITLLEAEKDELSEKNEKLAEEVRNANDAIHLLTLDYRTQAEKLEDLVKNFSLS